MEIVIAVVLVVRSCEYRIAQKEFFCSQVLAALLYVSGKLRFRSNVFFNESNKVEENEDVQETFDLGYTNSGFLDSQDDLQAVRTFQFTCKLNLV